MSNYCSGCGLSIPEPQSICSFCYGDPYYGSDGYLMDYLTFTEREKEQEWEEYCPQEETDNEPIF